MTSKDSVLVNDRESTKPSADGDDNRRSEGGQGENGSVRRIANVPVTQLEVLLRKLFDEDSDRFLELSVAEIRRELEKRLSLPDRTLKNAQGLVELIEQFDSELAKKEKSKDKEKERETKEKERERKEKEKERDREKHKSNHSSDKDRKSSHRSTKKKSQDKRKRNRRSSDSWDSDIPTKKPKRYSTSSESYDSDRRRRKSKKKFE